MSSGTSEPLLKTRQVAEALQVSVSTVKRWIDSGALAANRTVGKHRLVSDVELRRFAREQGMTFAERSLPPRASGATVDQSPTWDWASSPDRSLVPLTQALYQADALRARSILRGLQDQGVSADALADELIKPVMATIGHDWEIGAMDVFQEHEASSILAAILIEFNQRYARDLHDDAPVALGATVEGDPYELPLHLGELLLRERGWNVRNLGIGLPFPSLLKAIAFYKPRLVFLAVNGKDEPKTMLDRLRGLEDALDSIDPSPTVVVGGRMINFDVQNCLKRLEFGRRMRDLANVADRLLATPGRIPVS